MPTVIINPGTGPVRDATAELATACAEQLLADIADPTVRRGRPTVSGVSFARAPERDDGDGRFGFVFKLGERTATVDIPGLRKERVRYLGLDDQNIWHFPRLYINDSSFVWYYVVAILREEMLGMRDEDE